MLYVRWPRRRRLTVAHVTWTHLWPAARGSCQTAVTCPTPRRRRSARTAPRMQGHTKRPTGTVAHRRRTCRLTNACAHHTRRSFTVETLIDTHSQVIWVFCVFSCVLIYVQTVWLCETMTKILSLTSLCMTTRQLLHSAPTWSHGLCCSLVHH